MPDAQSQPAELPFEEAMERLEAIVSALEGERMPLEEMVRSYEEGARLLALCRSRIEAARHRVEKITADLEGGGKAVLSPFHAGDEAERDTDDEKAPARTARRKNDKQSDDIRLF
jgi:exodeoxyribonuclease VII small subunit